MSPRARALRDAHHQCRGHQPWRLSDPDEQVGWGHFTRRRGALASKGNQGRCRNRQHDHDEEGEIAAHVQKIEGCRASGGAADEAGHVEGQDASTAGIERGLIDPAFAGYPVQGEPESGDEPAGRPGAKPCLPHHAEQGEGKQAGAQADGHRVADAPENASGERGDAQNRHGGGGCVQSDPSCGDAEVVQAQRDERQEHTHGKPEQHVVEQNRCNAAGLLGEESHAHQPTTIAGGEPATGRSLERAMLAAHFRACADM